MITTSSTERWTWSIVVYEMCTGPLRVSLSLSGLSIRQVPGRAWFRLSSSSSLLFISFLFIFERLLVRSVTQFTVTPSSLDRLDILRGYSKFIKGSVAISSQRLSDCLGAVVLERVGWTPDLKTKLLPDTLSTFFPRPVVTSSNNIDTWLEVVRWHTSIPSGGSGSISRHIAQCPCGWLYSIPGGLVIQVTALNRVKLFAIMTGVSVVVLLVNWAKWENGVEAQKFR